jgi:hypothetical protein
MSDGFWPGPEILTVNLIVENQPFDSTWHEKFRCNRHGRLLADCTHWAFRLKAVCGNIVTNGERLLAGVQPQRQTAARSGSSLRLG